MIAPKFFSAPPYPTRGRELARDVWAFWHEKQAVADPVLIVTHAWEMRISSNPPSADNPKYTVETVDIGLLTGTTGSQSHQQLSTENLTRYLNGLGLRFVGNPIAFIEGRVKLSRVVTVRVAMYTDDEVKAVKERVMERLKGSLRVFDYDVQVGEFAIPLAGAVVEGSGNAFRYFDNDGKEVMPAGSFSVVD